jgi:Encapsulating protein for peroxidase
MDLPREIAWDAAVQQRISDAVSAEVGRTRICQKVFPTRALAGSPLDVLVDALDLPHYRVAEGMTRQFVEISQGFSLTAAQARSEPQSMICRTLSRMAAKAVALEEDMIIFRGRNAPRLPDMEVDQDRSAGTGLLGAAWPVDTNDDDLNRVSVPIEVRLRDPQTTGVYGEHVFAAVADGIAKLTSKGQAPPFALFLPTRVYADTFVPPGHQSLVTTADRIRPLVEGGFHGTGALPEHEGLLAALGGEPTIIYVGREAETEYVRQQGARYFFQVTERVQFVARDPRALVLLRFERGG